MILDAVSRGLKDAGLDESKIKQKIYRTANEFEDIVDNCSLAIDHKETIKGRSLKYLREVFLDEKKPNLNSSYAVFADIQMKIFNPKADFAKDYCPNYNKEAKPIIDSVLMAFGKELQLGPASIKGELNEKEILELINHLKNPENWSQLAYDYAKLTAHLESNMNLPMTPFFSKLKNDPGFRSQLIQIALQKSHDPSPYMDSFEVFKEKHKMAGKKIRHDIFGSGKDNSSQYSLPYAHLSSGKTDNIAKASLGKTRAKVGGGLQFKKKMIPLVLPPRSKSSEGSLADLLLVCDNSGSMKEASDGSGNVGSTSFVPWGDNSKYHHALLGFYGVENFLQRQGIAQYIKHGLSLFSSGTRYAEADFQGSEAVRKRALSPEWGNTRIDAGVLKNALQGRESFVLSLSDGGIENWAGERDEFRSLISNNYFAHIQIGEAPDFTRDLESWNVPVFYVSSARDLSRLMVKTTKDVYKHFVRK